ncbi:DHA2 family efflux MFS transporter permease subunit [Bartonella sp. HY329]|uniref:DHA2 family efflux MFS transporter permease subunit n=1 Tax=unclassified Bartonella TaxID=2645622 RepID=UPI0021C9AF84|nr:MULTISPECIES: DHA2 family efflux MFS transporter permease subunit [unclassified Bartonella]UXM95861.1 DHA2 family efflux MFS transporter permease subunit [Bartonella sp. HY329]UXN10186.1 DHA2 family efflux MFS transporter permease subunit [Bartonella sp. HY328]
MIRILPLVLAVALFMENMDANVISTSLPAIARDLDTSPIALKLALTSYLVSLAIFIPVSGWMADRFTARHIFRIAMAVFIFGSILCAISNSLTGFVCARFLQGIGGAMMSPVGRVLLIRSTPKADLINALAWLTMPALIGPLIGPPLGGFITTYFSWHWIFLINVPIGLLGMFFATLYLPRDEVPILRPLDWPGFFLSGIGLAGIIFGLSMVSLPALPMWLAFVTIFIGLITSYFYLRHAKTAKHPLLDLSLFKDPIFRKSITGGSFFRIGLGASPFLLPMMLQIAFGLSPLQSGLITFVGAIGALGMKLGATSTYRRFGFRKVLMFGSLFSAATIAINGLFTPQTPYLLMLGILLVGGFLRSLIFSGVNSLSYADIAQDKVSQAAPIASVAQQSSVALGVAIAGTVLEVSLSTHDGGLGLTDFHIAFFIVAAISTISFFIFRTLPNDAGHALAEKKAKLIRSEK